MVCVPHDLNKYDVTWESPSRDSSGSMPIGNGDIGLNVWCESRGDVVFYLAKSDAWDENGRLVKLGRVRVRLSPNPFGRGKPFRQELRLRTGEIVIKAGRDGEAVSLRVWVDADRPVVQVEAKGERPFDMRVELELWRRKKRELKGGEKFSAYGVMQRAAPVTVYPDVITDGGPDRTVWYHRNEHSIWGENLKLQSLGELTHRMPDPLLHRMFGGCIKGTGLVSGGRGRLRSLRSAKQFRLSVHCLTARAKRVEDWRRRLDRSMENADAVDLESARRSHRAWWRRFWNRSWVFVDGNRAADAVTRGYVLQRWINACAGRGAHPIKFNGSLFTVDARKRCLPFVTKEYDADFRHWGGAYWFQNTRLPYWTMPMAGDFDLMGPLFQMYRDALPLAKRRARAYYGHGGAFFPETMHFWGTYVGDNYGWDRKGKTPGWVDNPYIRYYWSGGVELSVIMTDCFEHTRDKAFLDGTLLPFADEIIKFFDLHWKRDGSGRIRFEPAQSLETWSVAVDPLPEIAGLKYLLSRLLELPASLMPSGRRAEWRRIMGELPDLPAVEKKNRKRLLPAAKFSNVINRENAELYAVFPYRLFGVGKPDMSTALEAWRRRRFKDRGGWSQDGVQAACLGLANEARDIVTRHFTTRDSGSRFPAFWGPNSDWVPDQDHGGVAMIALQRMIMQCDGKRILLLPAWPTEWNVSFRLHAPHRTIVEGVVGRGKLLDLRVTPATRRRDVVVISPGQRRAM